MKKIMILVVLFVVVASQLVVADKLGANFTQSEWNLLTVREKEIYLKGYIGGMTAIALLNIQPGLTNTRIRAFITTLSGLNNPIEIINNSDPGKSEGDNQMWAVIVLTLSGIISR